MPGNDLGDSCRHLRNHMHTYSTMHVRAAEKTRQAAPERTRQEPHKRHAPATPEGSLVDFTEEEL